MKECTKFKKRILQWTSFAIAVLLCGCASTEQTGEAADNSNKVVIFSSLDDSRNVDLQQKLDEKFPDLEIILQFLPTGKNAAKIKAEGEETECDIVLALETASFKQIADNFADVSQYDHEDYLEEVRSGDNRILTWEKFEGAFIVNPDVLAKNHLEEPKTYEDLLKPEYQNLIVMPNPKTSSTGYMFLNNVYNLWGEEAAFQYFDELQKNVKQFTESGSGPVKMLVQGEAAIGLGMVYHAVEQINQGANLKIIAPETGIVYNTSAFGIIKGKETKPNVAEVFTYLTEEYLQYDKENASPGKIFTEQENKIPNYPTDLKTGDMSTIFDSALQEKLLKQWKY